MLIVENNEFSTKEWLIQLLKCFDCTHKINKLGMPLLSIFGIPSRNQTFNVVFAFIEEDGEVYNAWDPK